MSLIEDLKYLLPCLRGETSAPKVTARRARVRRPTVAVRSSTIQYDDINPLSTSVLLLETPTSYKLHRRARAGPDPPGGGALSLNLTERTQRTYASKPNARKKPAAGPN